MPISGITHRHLTSQSVFAQIGIIRKGGPKRKKGEQEIFGEDLDHFRIELAEGEGKAEEELRTYYSYGPPSGERKKETYGPRDFLFIVPFNEVDRVWEAWREAYVAGAMLHRCDGDNIIREVDHRTGKAIVNNGLSVDTGQPVKCPCANDKKGATPALSYQKQSGKIEVVFCKPVGRLRLMLTPPLKRLAYFVLMTGSVNDIIAIDSALRGAAEMFKGIAGIPFLAKRVARDISTPTADGKRARRRKWMIEVEVDPVWMEAKFNAMGAAALLAVQTNAALLSAPALSFDIHDTYSKEEDDEGHLDEASPDFGADSEAVEQAKREWVESHPPEQSTPGQPESGLAPTTPKTPPPAPINAPAASLAPPKASPSPSAPPKPGGKANAGFLRDPREWERLFELAVKAGIYKAEDSTARYRMWKVVSKALKTFDTGDSTKGLDVLKKHYAEKENADDTSTKA